MDFAERFERFRSLNYGPKAKMPELAREGQKPEVLVITCIDSRVNVQNMFGLEPGDAMVLRFAGPIIPPYNQDNPISQILNENLALAINDHRISSLVLLGNTQCGAASKLAENIYNPGDIPCMKKAANSIIMSALDEASDHNKDELTKVIEKQIIIHGIKNLFDYPIIINAIKENRLTVEGLQVEIETGQLLKLSTNGKGFYFDVVAGSTANDTSSKTRKTDLKAANV